MRKMSLLSLVKNNNIDGVRDFLLNETININIHKYENIALIAASKYNYIEIVKLLLEVKNINVNLQDKYGTTALTSASQYNNIKIVKLLLEAENINVNLQDIDGKTALILASRKNNKEIVKLLLGKGATIPLNASYSDDINGILANWKTYLPRWDRFKTYRYYPKEFKEIAIQWLLICKRKNFVSKDIRLLMIEYFAESWKLN